MIGLWHITQAVFAFLLGISIGSFLNVVIIRLPKRESIVNPPSHCPGCGYNLHWYDNIPIFSYILLGGRCRECKTVISIQYPLVELLTGALAVALFLRFGLSWSLLFYFIFVAALVAITFIDLRYQIIPNEISLPCIPLGIVSSVVTMQLYWRDSVMGAVFGFCIIAIIAYGYYFLTKREGMGMGDAKLMAMIGAFLGWQAIPFVLLAASIQGLVVAFVFIGLGWARKEAPRLDPDEWEDGVEPEPGEEVPLRLAAIAFGPFLSLAAFEFLFFGNLYFKWLAGLA